MTPWKSRARATSLSILGPDVRAALAVIDLLIALLPKAFRSSFGREIRADFVDHWSDCVRSRTGVRRTLRLTGLFLSAVGIFIFPLAGTIALLYLARMVFASGSNASNTMSNALLADYIDNKDRGKAFGITASFGGIGALFHY